MNKIIGTSIVAGIALAVSFGASGCATKKYVRTAVNERVTPLEQRTGELEETSRRNSQDIAKLSQDLEDTRGRVGRAQAQADNALALAGQANTAAESVERSITNLRSNLDAYALSNTVAVNFNFDSAALTPEARASLDNIAGQIGGRDNFVLEIEGFADYVGTDEYNNQLTQRRADSVRRYLAEQHNVPLFRMYIVGFGKSRPVADNSTKEGRFENRRVEVRLLIRSASQNGASAQTPASGQAVDH